MPIGNGRLGATVWNERGMSYQLNHGSFFASAIENEMLVSSGHIDLVLPEEWMKGFVEERLSLADATVITKFRASKANYVIRSWVAEGLDVLVIDIEGTEAIPGLTLEISSWPRAPDAVDIPANRPDAELAISEKDVSLTTVGLSKRRAVSMVAGLLDGEVETAKVDDRHA